MIDKEYKSFYISHDYQQQSEKYDEINRYLIWTVNYEDLVAEEFETIEQAEQWIDENGAE
tara:strand:- start:36 stop:215 length:180 start_codon:yes stop_codon:yes gene_type:complete